MPNESTNVEEQVVRDNQHPVVEPLICSCGYDLRAMGHCGCGKWFSVCLGCHLPTRANRCQCAVKTRNPDYAEEWA